MDDNNEPWTNCEVHLNLNTTAAFITFEKKFHCIKSVTGEKEKTHKKKNLMLMWVWVVKMWVNQIKL